MWAAPNRLLQAGAPPTATTAPAARLTSWNTLKMTDRRMKKMSPTSPSVIATILVGDWVMSLSFHVGLRSPEAFSSGGRPSCRKSSGIPRLDFGDSRSRATCSWGGVRQGRGPSHALLLCLHD